MNPHIPNEFFTEFTFTKRKHAHGMEYEFTCEHGSTSTIVTLDQTLGTKTDLDKAILTNLRQALLPKRWSE